VDNLEEEVEKSYKFYIDMIIHFQDISGYNGDVQSLLQLPYCLFQDLIIERAKKRKVEESQ